MLNKIKYIFQFKVLGNENIGYTEYIEYFLPLVRHILDTRNIPSLLDEALYYVFIAISVMKLLAVIIGTLMKIPIQLHTHAVACAEKEKETNGRHDEHTRDIGVTAFAIQAFCANSCRH